MGRAGEPGVAVIGTGYWGMNHVRVWRDLGLLRLVVDPAESRRQEAAAVAPAADVASDLEVALNRADVLGVVIATPAVTHARIAEAAMRAGKDVLVEKPLATNLADAESIVALAASLDRIVMVGHVLEYHPAFRRLSELALAGELGKVHYVYSNRLNLGKVRTEENSLWSFAPHDIAMCLRLVGSEPIEVSCRGASYLSPDVMDVSLMSLAFGGGVQSHIFVSWLHPFKEHRFVVVGSRQMAVLDDTAPWPEKLVLYPHEIEWVGGRVPVARKAHGVAVAIDAEEPLVAECKDFARAIAHRRQPLADGAGGLRVLRVLDAGEKSTANHGIPIRLGRQREESNVSVHPTAIVDPGALVGAGTKIWHYTHVSGGARIGRGCMLGQNVFVGSTAAIGDGVRVQNNVSVYDGVQLDDDVFCGPSVVFTNVVNPRSAHPRKDRFLPTVVKRGATLGANATVLCGVTIGQHALVGAGAVVTRDVPDHALMVGVPARQTGWVSEVGERLDFHNGRAVCPQTGRTYVMSGLRVVAADADGAGGVQPAPAWEL